ncbi:hypothetical protein JI435_030440, partial [Parastagonospora nodorum SN15]
CTLKHHDAMVLLTMTPGIVRALARAEEASPDDFAKLQRPEDPTLADSKPGNPISHSQLIDLSKLLKKLPSDELPSQDEDTQKNKSNDDSITANDPSNTSTDTMSTPITLSSLLAHTKIYTPPPAPAPRNPPIHRSNGPPPRRRRSPHLRENAAPPTHARILHPALPQRAHIRLALHPCRERRRRAHLRRSPPPNHPDHKHPHLHCVRGVFCLGRCAALECGEEIGPLAGEQFGGGGRRGRCVWGLREESEGGESAGKEEA